MRRLLPSLGALLAATSVLGRSAFGACAAAAVLTIAWPVGAGVPVGARQPHLDLAHLATLDDGGATRAPLFDPERRSWTAGGSREDVLGIERPRAALTLHGVLIESDGRRALIDDGSGSVDWVREGDGRGAWRVVRIDPGRVVVADASQRYTIEVLADPVRLRPIPVLQRAVPPTAP